MSCPFFPEKQQFGCGCAEGAQFGGPADTPMISKRRSTTMRHPTISGLKKKTRVVAPAAHSQRKTSLAVAAKLEAMVAVPKKKKRTYRKKKSLSGHHRH